MDKLGLRWNLWQLELGVFTLGIHKGLDALIKRREKYDTMKKEMLQVYDDIDEEKESNPLLKEQEEVGFNSQTHTWYLQLNSCLQF